MFTAWKAIHLAVSNQISELESNQLKQQNRTPLELSKALYEPVFGWVSFEALRKVEEQRILLTSQREASRPCTGVFSNVYGLPCSHKLDNLQGPLLLEAFHSHWHLKRHGAPQLLLAPRQRIESIREQSSLPRSSTRREPSSFEVVEAQMAQRQRSKAPSKCTACHTVGHTRTSRQCPLRYSEIL